jgi:hypothetical protein
MPDGFLRNLPDGPGCERCGARTFVATIDPHPRKPRHAHFRFECPRCFHLQTMSVQRRGTLADTLQRLEGHIQRASSRILHQAMLVRRFDSQGRDTQRERSFLELLQQSHEGLIRYRELLLRQIDRQNAEAGRMPVDDVPPQECAAGLPEP